MNVNPSLLRAAIAAPNQIPAVGLIEFRFKVIEEDVVIQMDPNNWDSIVRATADIRNYARVLTENKRRYLCNVARKINAISTELFTLDHDEQDWAATLEFQLRALAFSVGQQFYPPMLQRITGSTNDLNSRCFD